VAIVAKLYDKIMLTRREDVELLGTNKSLDVECVVVDLKRRSIEPPWPYEQHMKFNPWEDVTEEEEKMLLEVLYTKFRDQEIYQKILIPLFKE
jgi:hypothetical protein